MTSRYFHLFARTQFVLLLFMCAMFLTGATKAMLDLPTDDWATFMQNIYPRVTSLPTAIAFFLPMPVGVLLVALSPASVRIVAAASATLYVVAVLMTLAITLPISARAQETGPAPTVTMVQDQNDWKWANLMRAAFGAAAFFVLFPVLRQRPFTGKQIQST